MKRTSTPSRRWPLLIKMALPALAFLLGVEVASAQSFSYEVTITNLTRAQQFTPILVVTHRSNVELFELGSPASAELETLAEEGNTAPLTTLLRATEGVFDVNASVGLLNPGASVTVQISSAWRFGQFSVASMLIPTNDAFFAVQGAQLPVFRRTLTSVATAYDAGGEPNDELCASIPGPFFVECGGPGLGGSPAGGEGYVFVHAGIHGIGDIDAAMRDWRNPVAKVSVRQAP